jgi:hypothetical protein
MEDIAIIDLIVPPPSVIEVVAGTKGDPGPPGPPGGSSSVFFYRVDAQGITASDPGAGKVRYNHAVQANATALYVDWLTADGFDAHLFFELAAPAARLVIQDKDLAVNHQIFELTGPGITHPDWFEVPVAFVSSTMGGGFSHNQNVAALLVAAGATLPTAPLGQVLSSQGDGIPPAFTKVLLLLNAAGPVNQRAWQLHVQAGGDFMIQQCDDAGVLQGPRVGIDPYYGGFYTAYGGFTALNGAISGSWLTPAPHTFADTTAPGFKGNSQVGNLLTITDSTTATPGAVIVGGGAFNVLARWNGTHWIVISG